MNYITLQIDKRVAFILLALAVFGGSVYASYLHGYKQGAQAAVTYMLENAQSFGKGFNLEKIQ